MSRSNQQDCTNIVQDLDPKALCERKSEPWELEMPDMNRLPRSEGEADSSDLLKTSQLDKQGAQPHPLKLDKENGLPPRPYRFSSSSNRLQHLYQDLTSVSRLSVDFDLTTDDNKPASSHSPCKVTKATGAQVYPYTFLHPNSAASVEYKKMRQNSPSRLRSSTVAKVDENSAPNGLFLGAVGSTGAHSYPYETLHPDTAGKLANESPYAYDIDNKIMHYTPQPGFQTNVDLPIQCLQPPNSVIPRTGSSTISPFGSNGAWGGSLSRGRSQSREDVYREYPYSLPWLSKNKSERDGKYKNNNNKNSIYNTPRSGSWNHLSKLNSCPYPPSRRRTIPSITISDVESDHDLPSNNQSTWATIARRVVSRANTDTEHDRLAPMFHHNRPRTRDDEDGESGRGLIQRWACEEEAQINEPKLGRSSWRKLWVEDVGTGWKIVIAILILVFLLGALVSTTVSLKRFEGTERAWDDGI